jgi:hypothetical protein
MSLTVYSYETYTYPDTSSPRQSLPSHTSERVMACLRDATLARASMTWGAPSEESRECVMWRAD